MRNIPKQRRWLIVGSAVFAIIGVGASSLKSQPRLIWNATASAPVGLYWLRAHEFRRGDLVLVQPPLRVATLAAERHYLPYGVPLVKRVAGTAGDTICAENHKIQINGSTVATALERDVRGREMPSWEGCRYLQTEVFLLMSDAPDSFDGRYFGPVPATAVIGPLTPLWIR